MYACLIFFWDGVRKQDHIVQCVGYFAWKEKPIILKGCQVEMVID